MKKRLSRVWRLLRTILPLWLRARRRPVLFVRPGALGDIICTFPAAEELKRRHVGAEIVYCCKPEFTCLPRMAGITPWVVSEDIAEESCWLFLFSAVYFFSYGDEHADTASFHSLIEEFCRQHQVPVRTEYPRLQVQPAVLERVKVLLLKRIDAGKPLALIHLGPSWPIREWPRDSWISLVRQLNQSVNVVQVGTSSHVELGKVADNSIPGVVSLVDQLTLEESIALISLGELFVGVDSGLLHIAAAMRTRAVGIFGPTSPQIRFPKLSSCSFVVSPVECQGCHHRVPRLHWFTGCPYQIRCMEAISMESVLQICLAGLNETRKDARL